uniref:CD109 molecule n=1 Tax=Phocoena sinus TaxID=42100 RepID=A0A8C9E6I1_PHOSS
MVTAPGIIRPGGNVTIGVELLEHSPSQVTVKAELVKIAANLAVSVLEAEGVFEKGRSNKTLLDPKSNLIQQWLSEQSDLGVVSKTFQLSSHPMLGDWSIQVQVNDQTYYQSFQVSEYVLPKFEVTLQTPLYCSLNSVSLNGTVTINGSSQNHLTGISRNASSNVFFKQHDYSLNFLIMLLVLKAISQLHSTVKVTRSDGNQLTPEERRNNVVMTVTQRNYTEHWNRWDGRNQDTGAVQIINHTVPPNGIFKIEFPILDDSSELQLKASFLDTVSSMAVHDMFKDENIKAGSPFERVVSGNKQLKEFSYMVVSRGQLVAVENSWAPKACIIVYYIEDDGEIINDVLKVPVQLVFKNKIQLFWSKANAEPSERVSLRITVAQPNSIVGIVAVDKSVNLMNVSNDITMENVVHELELYNTGYYLGMFMNSFAVFQECGLWVLTDANLVKDFIDVYDHIAFLEENEGYLVDFHDFSSGSSPRVRKHFPETWIWLDTSMGSRTYQEFEVTVPDSITSWVATAFVISEDLGLGLTTAPVELQSFQPFFIFLNLPYSVIRGEEFALEVTIFNYLKDATEVKVIIEKSDTFDILMASNEINVTGHQQTVLVPSEDGATVLFPVRPTRLGEMPITVTAVSPAASDAVTQRILVKAEGIEKSYSQSILLDLTDSKLQTTLKTLSFSFPPHIVSGSERVQITAIGDILGSSISGLASLIRMPYGCGEQNMINFAPNIYVLDYLTKKKQLTENLKEKALSFMRQGYQRELLYQREDGSFSAFGNDDPSGSTWLSAFVLRCFLEADPYIDIDQNVLHRAYTWLKGHQKSNGEFWEPGRVIHSELQGGNKSPVTLTAYIVTSLLGYKKYQPNSDVQESINFLESEFDRGISDNYTLALVTYALSSVRSPKAKDALNMLTWRAEQEGDMQFWVSPVSRLSESWQPSSLDIEVAAYAMLSHFLQHQISEGIPIMRWLSRQRNSLGGFASTQDTIVALKALSEFAALMNTEETDIQVTMVGSGSRSPVKFVISTQNRFLLQTAELAVVQPTAVNISASGFGFAICQLNVIYNVKDSRSSIIQRSIQDQEAFDLDIAVKDDKDDINHLNLNVCTRFLGPGRSGMALMEINLLSGFTVSSDAISPSETVKKVEHDHGKLNLYLDSVNETQFCVDIPSVRNFRVSNTQDASVSIMDYYEPRRQAVRSYNSRAQLSSCDLCGDAHACGPCDSVASASLSHPNACLLVCFMLLFSLQCWL